MAARDAAPLPGYTRYQPSPVTVMPGQTQLVTEWVGAPFDHDVYVLDVEGLQGPGGHHALLYSSAEIEPVGTRKTITDSEQFKLQLIGGLGGTAGATLKAPPGTALRIPAHRALVIQTHWINASRSPLTTEAYVDLKLQDAAPDLPLASSFGFPTEHVDIRPRGETTYEHACPVPKDLKLLLFSNHMHANGVRARSVLEAGDRSMVLKEDSSWNPEWTAAPNFTRRTLDAPLVLPAGSKVRITCVWQNNTDAAIRYPDEMCVFFGFYLGDEDLSFLPCDDTGNGSN